MKYIEVTKEIYTMSDCASQNTKTGVWEPMTPSLYDCNLKEWFIHNVLKKHFTFGQPYCVVCGCKQVKEFNL